MRLSVVFELLLVFLFLAFAAARVIDPAKGTKHVAVVNKKTATTLRQGPPNRYCACTSRMCNCCRDFSLPVVPIKGPGCASIMYVQRDTMMVTMSFGDRVLSNTTITGKSPKPICMALPGGISQFCGRVYGISRKGDQFRACLGLELRALDDIEAALRVSCFKFGPKGVKLESAPPVPATSSGGKDPEEDEDDDYDLDDDEDDEIIGFGVDDDDDGASSEDNEVDSDSVDYTGFSVLGEDILGSFFSDDSESSSSKKKKPSKKTAKPQVVVPKISTTTRRPILGNKRRSTVKPLSSVTSRPVLNVITRRPSVSTSRPLLVQRPSVPVIISSQGSAKPGQLITVTKHGVDKNVVTKSTTTTTEAPVTTRIITTMQSQESEKVHMTEEVSQDTTVVTEEPITFTIPTEKVEVVKNDIKLPQTDLAKVEAVAAIAQQDVTSGVISSSSLTTEEVKKPMEMVTVKYEKITQTYAPQTTPSYYPENTQKISSIKFVPTTVVTSRPSAEVVGDSSEGDSSAVGEVIKRPQLVGIKNKVTFHQQTMTQNNAANHQGHVDLGTIIDKNTLTKKGNYTVNLKKQPVKRPEKEEDEEEEEEEEEAEEEDLLEGVLSDDEETDNEEQISSQTTNKDEASDEEEEDDDSEDDILGEAVETTQKVKPSRVPIKKPASDESDNEEEEEEEDDILEVLGDDDEEEETDDDDDDEEEEEEAEPEKIKKKKKPSTQATTIKIKRPTTQQIIQTKKPVTTTEVATKPDEKVTEKVTEKIIIYKEPEKVTEKVIIYQEPDVNKIPNKIFIYKDPENKISQQTTQKIIFYKEPVQQSVTEKFIIYKEPQIKVTEKPFIMEDSKSSEEVKDNSDEDRIEQDDDSSEEEFEEDDSDGKHTLMASIVKPGFSNKYAEEHDLTENDDLDIEDSDDEGNDFEEDRKMKEKKQTQKTPPSKKPEVQVNKPKILSLSDLIGQRKKHYDDKPISTSRTHRRMNLDRLLQLQGTPSVDSPKTR